MPSVLQEWVMGLPLREQGVLLTGARGCDLTPKFPLDSTARQLTAFLRYCFMVPVDDRETDIAGAFFQSEPPVDWRVSELGHYPTHWVMHIMHCFEVVGYRHPDKYAAAVANAIYLKFVDSFHLLPEPKHLMIDRLSEDRIEKGNVVS